MCLHMNSHNDCLWQPSRAGREMPRVFSPLGGIVAAMAEDFVGWGAARVEAVVLDRDGRLVESVEGESRHGRPRHGGAGMTTGGRRSSSGLERPAEAIEVTLFRQILLVPFAIESAQANDPGLPRGSDRVLRLAEKLRPPWQEITESRWRHLPTDATATSEELADAYAEFVYFEPYVQRFLFGRRGEAATESPIRLWRRTDIRALDLAVQLSNEHPREHYRLRVERLNFYAFDTGNAILVVEVAFDPALAAKLPDGDPCLPNLAQAQTVIERLRRVFPPYFAPFDTSGNFLDRLAAPLFPVSLRWVTGDPEQAPHDFTPDELMLAQTFTCFVERHRVPPMHARWRELLDGLPIEGYPETCRDCRVRLSQLGDDRAFSLSILGVDDVRSIGEPDWVRLLMCDEPKDEWPYSPTFLKGWEEAHGYDRHFNQDTGNGTRFLVSAYSFAMVGQALPPDTKDFCFYRDIFAHHGRRHYFQLCLIAYFQKTALLTLSERLADAMRFGKDANDKAAHEIEDDILHFTHRYWFESLSAQIQAQEIFEILRRNLRLRELYAQVRQEVREADAFAASTEQRDLADSAQRLNVIAAAGLAASVIVGFFGMNVFMGGNEFMKADRDFVLGWSLFMAGFFATLFVWREGLVSWFAKSCWARFAVPFALLAGGLVLLLGRAGG